MNRTVVGVDIAKRVFQLHWVELGSAEIVSVQLKRAKFLEHFANRLPCLIGMEACGGSQHWARELHKLGHEVKLLSARMVKAFVSFLLHTFYRTETALPGCIVIGGFSGTS